MSRRSKEKLLDKVFSITCKSTSHKVRLTHQGKMVLENHTLEQIRSEQVLAAMDGKVCRCVEVLVGWQKKDFSNVPVAIAREHPCYTSTASKHSSNVKNSIKIHAYRLWRKWRKKNFLGKVEKYPGEVRETQNHMDVLRTTMEDVFVCTNLLKTSKSYYNDSHTDALKFNNIKVEYPKGYRRRRGVRRASGVGFLNITGEHVDVTTGSPASEGAYIWLAQEIQKLWFADRLTSQHKIAPKREEIARYRSIANRINQNKNCDKIDVYASDYHSCTMSMNIHALTELSPAMAEIATRIVGEAINRCLNLMEIRGIKQEED